MSTATTQARAAQDKLDTAELESKVKAMYRDVAANPHGEPTSRWVGHSRSVSAMTLRTWTGFAPPRSNRSREWAITFTVRTCNRASAWCTWGAGEALLSCKLPLPPGEGMFLLMVQCSQEGPNLTNLDKQTPTAFRINVCGTVVGTERLKFGLSVPFLLS